MTTAANTVLANTGEIITDAYMNTNTFHKMIAADEIKNRFLTVMKTATAVLVDSEARSVIESASGIRIHLYDKMYKPEETAAAEKYLPDGYVVLAPSGSLGNMYYVATPEEARPDGWHLQRTGFRCEHGVAVPPSRPCILSTPTSTSLKSSCRPLSAWTLCTASRLTKAKGGKQHGRPVFRSGSQTGAVHRPCT